ncbi:MAG: glycosyltransferase, partial [Phycisphaeraceae bacterium]
LAVSPTLMRDAAEHGVHPDRLRLVPNAIDLAEFARRQTREQAKRSFNLDATEHAIGVVARFSVEKGVDRAIRLFAQLRAQRPGLRLHLIGDGPQRAALERLADELNAADAIRWWGWQRDTRPIVEAMDTMLLTSHTEGLPNSVLEAMAVGLPVAATPVGAVPEVLDAGDCGVLLDADESRWCDQVLPLIDHPIVRERLLCAAWMRVNARYDFANRMRRVACIYDELLDIEQPSQALRQAA